MNTNSPYKGKKKGQHGQDKYEDTKGIIRSRTLKKDRQYNGQMKSDQMTNNDLQNNYQQNITLIFTNTTIQNKLHLQREHSKLYLQTEDNKLHL